jgi:hypothetical protein
MFLEMSKKENDGKIEICELKKTIKCLEEINICLERENSDLKIELDDCLERRGW